MNNIDQIKQSKLKSYIYKFNQQNGSIAKENMKLLWKIQKVRTSLRKSISQERQNRRYTVSYGRTMMKKHLTETERQNQRIATRMKKMSSNLSQKSLMRDYAKSQLIKNRLMKYGADNNRVYLKSDVYLDEGQKNICALSQKVSCIRSPPTNPKNQSSSSQLRNPPPTAKNNQVRKSTLSHYKKQQIIKNKVDTSTSNLAAIKSKSNRPKTTIDPEKDQKISSNFFATQPEKNKNGKKIYVQ